MSILLILLAILPGLAISYAIYRYDKYDREPAVPLIICFILGALSTYPATKLEQLGTDYGLDGVDHFGWLLFHAFILVGFSEEIFKFLILVFVPYPRKYFDEPLDGIVYALMIGMGFATVENLLYAYLYGIETIAIRAFTAVPMHAVIAILSGYFVGLSKFNPESKWKLITIGLGIAIFAHGLYDFFILQEYYNWLMLLAVPTLMAGIYLGYQMITEQRKVSKIRMGKKNREEV